MSTFKFLDNEIYYEVHGEGSPILLLNGILMSTASWTNFVTSFSANNQLILVDFLDQGKSERMVGKSYSQADQVEVVRELLNHLNLSKVDICGISYGGEVAIQFSSKYPECVDKLVLSNTTARTSPWLKDLGDCWNLAGAQENPGELYYLTAIPVIYSCGFYEKNLDWMKNRQKMLSVVFNDKVVQATFKRLVKSAENYDARDRLDKIVSKTLVITSKDDILTPPNDQEYLVQNIKNSNLVVLPNVGHASMYECPEVWASLVLGFLNMKTSINL